MRRLVLTLLVVACRPTGATDAPRAPFDHRRSDYESRAHEPVGVARDLVAQLADAAPRSTATPSIVVDERLSIVAEEVAERSRDGRFVALPEMTTIARESGSLLFPLQAVALEPSLLEPGWPDAVLRSVGGRGPIAVGTSTPREGAPVVIVFARSLVRLPNAVPAAGTTRLEIEIDPSMNAMTPELLLVGADGTTHLSMTSVGERRFAADRPEGVHRARRDPRRGADHRRRPVAEHEQRAARLAAPGRRRADRPGERRCARRRDRGCARAVGTAGALRRCCTRDTVR